MTSTQEVVIDARVMKKEVSIASVASSGEDSPVPEKQSKAAWHRTQSGFRDSKAKVLEVALFHPSLTREKRDDPYKAKQQAAIFDMIEQADKDQDGFLSVKE